MRPIRRMCQNSAGCTDRVMSFLIEAGASLTSELRRCHLRCQGSCHGGDRVVTAAAPIVGTSQTTAVPHPERGRQPRTREFTAMTVNLSDTDKANLRIAAYGAITLLSAAGAAGGSPHKIAATGSIALGSATG